MAAWGMGCQSELPKDKISENKEELKTKIRKGGPRSTTALEKKTAAMAIVVGRERGSEKQGGPIEGQIGPSGEVKGGEFHEPEEKKLGFH